MARDVRQLWALASTGVVALAAAVGAAAHRSTEPPWPIGSRGVVEVGEGRARAVLDAGDRFLLVVSTLTREPGAYPIRLTARPSEAPVTALRGLPELPVDHRPSAKAKAVRPADPVVREPAPVRDFYLPIGEGSPADAAAYRRVQGICRASSPRLAVYVDRDDLDRVDSSTLDDILATFDEHILPVACREVGTAADIDGDGRFTVLLSGWLSKLSGGRVSVDGYVRGADFEPSQGPPFGNRGDVMYLNAGLKSGPHLRTVMAHEYTHAVNYCRKALGPRHQDEEGWLDEAIAHLSEDLHGFSRSNIDHRVDAFLERPERFRLIVEDFGSPELIRSHGHRGGAYLFLRWCSDRFGPSLYRDLVTSDLRGVANLEAATGCRFEDLYRRWACDLASPQQPAEARTPRFATIAAGGEPDHAVLDATSTHYAIVEGMGPGRIEVEIVGPPEAKLQVTAVRLPPGRSVPVRPE